VPDFACDLMAAGGVGMRAGLQDARRGYFRSTLIGLVLMASPKS